MPKKAGEFLIGLAKKSGLELSPEQMEHINKIDVELTDEFITPIDKSLISLKDAMSNHSDIRNHYHAQIYDGFDASLKTLMDELELGDNERNAILTERNTNKRLPLLVKKVKELEHLKANADKPDKAAINKQIEDYNTEIRQVKEARVKDKEEFDRQLKQYRIDSKKTTLYSPYKTIHDELNPEVKDMIIRSLIDKELQDNNAQMDFDANGNFVLLKKDGMNYFGDNNQTISPTQFVESVLSRNKQLVTTQKQTAQSAAGDTNNGQQGNPAGGSANSNGNASNHQAKIIKSMNAEAIRDLKQNAQNPIFGGGVA